MSGITEIVRDNFKTIVVLIGGYIVAAETGHVGYPDVSMPSGWGLAVTAVIVGGLVAHYYADEILSLLPDEEGVYIFAFKSSDETGGQLYELTEDQFEDMQVVNGTLFEWKKSPKRVYEVREYDRERNVAVANWRESVAASQFAGDATVAEAMEFIEEIREEFEPDSAKLRRLQRRLRGVARKMDLKRLEDQQAVLDPHLAPSFGDDGAGVADILQDVVDDELLPESMSGEDDDRVSGEHSNGNGDGDAEEFVSFDVLDDGDALAPEETN